jgi:hypothetical protein
MDLFTFHPESPDVIVLVFNSATRDFRPGKEIKGLRGGVRRCAAQASPRIVTVRAEKYRFRMKTI